MHFMECEHIHTHSHTCHIIYTIVSRTNQKFRSEKAYCLRLSLFGSDKYVSESHKWKAFHYWEMVEFLKYSGMSYYQGIPLKEKTRSRLFLSLYHILAMWWLFCLIFWPYIMTSSPQTQNRTVNWVRIPSKLNQNELLSLYVNCFTFIVTSLAY